MKKTLCVALLLAACVSSSLRPLHAVAPPPSACTAAPHGEWIFPGPARPAPGAVPGPIASIVYDEVGTYRMTLILYRCLTIGASSITFAGAPPALRPGDWFVLAETLTSGGTTHGPYRVVSVDGNVVTVDRPIGRGTGYFNVVRVDAPPSDPPFFSDDFESGDVSAWSFVSGWSDPIFNDGFESGDTSRWR